jgi:hypothetical protein
VTGLLLLSCLNLAAPAALSSEAVVRSYLSALQAFDHRDMSRLWADDAVSEAPGSAPHPIDRERMRDMRGFERVMHTRWSWTIVDAGAPNVTVRLVEANDLYTLLGAGDCVQTVVYSTRAGKISRMATREIAYSGLPFRQTFAAFKAWLLSTAAASDPAIIREGQVRFTPESARRICRWLRIWHDRSER